MSSMTARAGAGSGEVPGRTLSLRLPAWTDGVWLFHGMRPGRVPREAWLKKGLLKLEVALPVLAGKVFRPQSEEA